MTFTLADLIRFVVALGLINVWLFRSMLSTPFRGGAAKNLREEFRVYGLGDAAFWCIGALKLSCAGLFLASPWFAEGALPAAVMLCVLMLGAIAMHIKAKDPVVKSLPALVMLLLNVWLVLAA
ncbi:MAG: DoxX family protein [Oligoflexia bacterium]